MYQSGITRLRSATTTDGKRQGLRQPTQVRKPSVKAPEKKTTSHSRKLAQPTNRATMSVNRGLKKPTSSKVLKPSGMASIAKPKTEKLNNEGSKISNSKIQKRNKNFPVPEPEPFNPLNATINPRAQFAYKRNNLLDAGDKESKRDKLKRERMRKKKQAQKAEMQSSASQLNPQNTGRSNKSLTDGNDFTAYSSVRSNKIGLTKNGGGNIEDIQTPCKNLDKYSTIGPQHKTAHKSPMKLISYSQRRTQYKRNTNMTVSQSIGDLNQISERNREKNSTLRKTDFQKLRDNKKSQKAGMVNVTHETDTDRELALFGDLELNDDSSRGFNRTYRQRATESKHLRFKLESDEPDSANKNPFDE